MSFLNGLSAAGASIAQYAGSAGLELQKSELAKQQMMLADQLATTRETTLQGQAQTFAAGQQSNQQQFLATQAEKDQTFRSGQTDKELGVRVSEGAASRAADIARTKMTLDADAPEIKSAKQFSQLPPEQKKAYREEIMLKAGLPPWMMGDDAAGSVPASPSDSVTGTPATTGDATTPAADTSTATPSRSGLNDKALAKLPPTAQSLVKGMVDGRISPPSSFAASKPYWQNLIQMATTYDPTFDETSWQGRVATRKDFASGQSAKAVTAMNTALAHAGTLAEDFEKLNNSSLGTVVNTPINAMQSAFGDARQTKAEQTVNALASEARKVFAASGGGSLSELEKWEKTFPLNGSPAQQKAALRGFVELLDGRLQALADQYNRGMGKTDDPVSLLQPKARAVYEQLTGNTPKNAVGYQDGKAPDAGTHSSAAPAPAPSAAIPSWVKPGDQYSPSRGQARSADGTVYGPQ